MIAILSLLIIFALSLLIVRVGTIALVMTGVSEDVAKFQARLHFQGRALPPAKRKTWSLRRPGAESSLF
jgi:hypothetical protein